MSEYDERVDYWLQFFYDLKPRSDAQDEIDAFRDALDYFLNNDKI